MLAVADVMVDPVPTTGSKVKQTHLCTDVGFMWDNVTVLSRDVYRKLNVWWKWCKLLPVSVKPIVDGVKVVCPALVSIELEIVEPDCVTEIEEVSVDRLWVAVFSIFVVRPVPMEVPIELSDVMVEDELDRLVVTVFVIPVPME